MIINNTLLDIADNSGVKVAKCIMVKGKTHTGFGSIGESIICVARKVTTNSKVKKGTVVKAVIVRTKKNLVRDDGTTVSFSDNAAVLIDNNNEPIGTRVFGPVAREVKDKKFVKIVSLASEVL